MWLLELLQLFFGRAATNIKIQKSGALAKHYSYVYARF
jgi:hypothetical protein